MIVETLKRTLIAGAVALLAPTLFAAYPSARTGLRLAYDEANKAAVLFGGSTLVDSGTAKQYELDETWLWDGEKWIQQYPAHRPAGRDSHAMVYDRALQQILLFGGRDTTQEFNDTWIYKNGDWEQLAPADSPSKRVMPGMAFDLFTNRVTLYGGTSVSADGLTVTKHRDMWEFDGSNWIRLLEEGPDVNKPLLVYDEARGTLLMMAFDDTFKTHMYAWNRDAKTWDEITPETLPQCVNESSLIYSQKDEKPFLLGGVCAVEGNQSSTTEEIWLWDGTTWAKQDVTSQLFRVNNAGLTYDKERNEVLMFGGTTAFSTPRSTTYRLIENDWSAFTDVKAPGPRSLFGIATDPNTDTTYVIGGLTDLDFFTDFWKYKDGAWEKLTVENGPQCAVPVAAFDPDRNRLLVLCPDSTTFEWDGTAWADKSPSKRPPGRRFSSMVYDQNMRKTVLFGGLDDEGEYTGRTWLWDGTTWTELKKKKPHSRDLTSMWYDPVLRKTVIFGGLGRRNRDAQIERYTDMWSLDADGWKEIKPAAMPTTRYGAQAAVDPRTNRVILFGGLRLDEAENDLKKQVYADDTWEWDGTTWRRVQTAATATARENGAMFFDPSTDRLLLFGGWSGYFHSDLWEFEDNAWQPAQ